MKIAFYAPFKPLGHKNPSGDLIIAQGLVNFLKQQGHEIKVQSRLRARWIYFKPWLWLVLFKEYIQIAFRLLQDPPDLWLTYHSYYKAPDLIGPWICKMMGLKYLIFQGIYSTKQKRRIKTIPGFYLNRAALLQADHIFTNKAPDLKNLKRLISESKLSYIKPGILPHQFENDKHLGNENLKRWSIPECPIVLTAAMFRDDVKTKGLIWLIECLGKLKDENKRFHLVIAGSGQMEENLRKIADQHLPEYHTFVGKIERDQMPAFYSAGDVFAFPGIGESLGMVFLEAQSCGLPVIAFDNAGIPEVVENQKTGFLVPLYDGTAFSTKLAQLLSDKTLCRQMGEDAAFFVRKNHSIEKNYKKIEMVIQQIIRR